MTTTDLAFDERHHILGDLCKKGHDYQGTGKSVRYKGNRNCVLCYRGSTEKSMEKFGGQRAYARQRRQRLVEQGMCVRCIEKPAVNGFRTCEECTEKRRVQQKQTREHDQRIQQTRRTQRIESGQCQKCGDQRRPDSKFCQNCLDLAAQRSKAYRIALRQEVVNRYGGQCECCGENRLVFLNIDHINNDGKRHRDQLGGKDIYVWLKDNGCPTGFQVLCWNCNIAKHVLGRCPHQEE